MRSNQFQFGIGLNGLITLLLVFVVFAFGIGWLANNYYANRLSLVSSKSPDFPYVINVGAEPDGMTWNGQELIFSNRASPWGVVRVTPLENGQYQKTTLPVVDKFNQQISIQGITWNGTSYVALSRGDWFQSEHKKVFVELDPVTFKVTRILGNAPENIQCIAWDGLNYWAGTRLHTANEKGRSILYQFDKNLKKTAAFDGAGIGCQGMVWDGKFLWWGDVFGDTITLFDISSSIGKKPVIAHQFKLSINQQSGIGFDGKNIWFGDDQKQRLLRLKQELYFDWLGNHFEIEDAGQIILVNRFGNFQTGDTNLDDLIKPLLDGKIKNSDITGYVESLRSRYSIDEIRHVLIRVRDKVTEKSLITMLDKELNKLVSAGKIDYEDNIPVLQRSIKVSYFKGQINDGNLVANWKIVAGNEILSGVDAPRPQQLPNDFEFYTYIHYRVRVTGDHSELIKELEYDLFGNEDIQEGVALIEGISPGEYKIYIETNAQYYSETKAKSYDGTFELKVTY